MYQQPNKDCVFRSPRTSTVRTCVSRTVTHRRGVWLDVFAGDPTAGIIRRWQLGSVDRNSQSNDLEFNGRDVQFDLHDGAGVSDIAVAYGGKIFASCSEKGIALATNEGKHRSVKLGAAGNPQCLDLIYSKCLVQANPLQFQDESIRPVRLLYGSSDKGIKLLDIEESVRKLNKMGSSNKSSKSQSGGSFVSGYSGHVNVVRCCKADPFTKQFFISGSADQTVRLWDYASKKELLILRGHTSSIESVIYMTPTLVGSGDLDGNLNVWDLRTARAVRSYSGHLSSIISLNSTREADLISSSFEGRIRWWDLRLDASAGLVGGGFVQSGIKSADYFEIPKYETYDRCLVGCSPEGDMWLQDILPVHQAPSNSFPTTTKQKKFESSHRTSQLSTPLTSGLPNCDSAAFRDSTPDPQQLANQISENLRSVLELVKQPTEPASTRVVRQQTVAPSPPPPEFLPSLGDLAKKVSMNFEKVKEMEKQWNG